MNSENQETSTLSELIIQIVKSKHPETIKQLVELVNQQYPLPEQKIIEHILDLQKQGKLNLKEETSLVSSTLKNYLLSSPSYWYWAVITLALVTTIIVFIIPESAIPLVYARYALGSLFVLFLPGYAFIKALFPTKELDNIERIALSVGMSLALVPITGLILYYTPWGINTAPITICLLGLTIFFATVAATRTYQARTPKIQ